MGSPQGNQNKLITVLTEDDRWQKTLPDVVANVTAWCEHVLAHAPEAAALREGLAKENVVMGLNVSLADNATIQELNHQFRGKDKPTNVLSFPAYDNFMEALDEDPSIRADGVISLGDVMLAFECVEQEAVSQRKSFHDHLAHLVMHGCLHVLGYDHEEESEAEEMEALEIQLLGQVSIANPYETQ